MAASSSSRGLDGSNWLGADYGGSQLRMLKSIAGTTTDIGGGTITAAANSEMALSTSPDGNWLIGYLNFTRATVIDISGITTLAAAKKAGFAPHFSVLSPFLDNFSCGIAA